MKKIFPFFVLLAYCSVLTASAQFPKVKIGTKSTGLPGLSLKFVARIQGYYARSQDKRDIYDKTISSPKSALILEKIIHDTLVERLYVNNLEGGLTSVYNLDDSCKKIAEIKHQFVAGDSALFKETNFEGYNFKAGRKNVNIFEGKPVEMCLSNNNKYLWVPYYRRDYDKQATEPSALALIDVDNNKIIRVFPTAPLPKMVACSDDDKYIAVTNWGDNTVHLIDISSGNPAQFHYIAHFIVDYRLSLNFNKRVDRDSVCGLCLRGTVFTPDNNYLFVGRMGGGGIAIFSLKNKKYLGSVFGTKKNVRHLVIKDDYLYLSSNDDGVVEQTRWEDILNYFLQHQGHKKIIYPQWKPVTTGAGARTISLTADGAYLFATANNVAKISIVRTRDMKVTGSIRADPFPVGMVLDKVNKYLVVTAQGKKNKGGNSVMIYEVTRR